MYDKLKYRILRKVWSYTFRFFLMNKSRAQLTKQAGTWGKPAGWCSWHPGASGPVWRDCHSQLLPVSMWGCDHVATSAGSLREVRSPRLYEISPPATVGGGTRENVTTRWPASWTWQPTAPHCLPLGLERTLCPPFPQWGWSEDIALRE